MELENLENKSMWDKNGVRYRLVHVNGKKALNTLLVPGGPGGDSSYLFSLVQTVSFPGNVWLVDFSGNGTNNPTDNSEVFEKWFSDAKQSVALFQNVVYIGHSFGAMLALSIPELEQHLKGLIILNSSPTYWIEEMNHVIKKKNLPVFEEKRQEFAENPSPESFKRFALSLLPYYFTSNKLSEGEKLFEDLVFNYHASDWWLHKTNKEGYYATWAPKKIPTLVVLGEEDVVCSPSLFLNDSRFKRKNIKITVLKEAAHFPWIEKPQEVKNLLNNFYHEIKD